MGQASTRNAVHKHVPAPTPPPGVYFVFLPCSASGRGGVGFTFQLPLHLPSLRPHFLGVLFNVCSLSDFGCQMRIQKKRGTLTRRRERGQTPNKEHKSLPRLKEPPPLCSLLKNMSFNRGRPGISLFFFLFY